MKRSALLFLASVLAMPALSADLPETSPEQVGMSSRRLSRLSDSLDDYIQRGELPGAVTVIARRGRLVHFDVQGFRDLDAKKPMTRDTVFQIRSMTKPITSVAVMMLFEEGRFLLNDPISKFLPEFAHPKVVASPSEGANPSGPNTIPADRQITIRDLLAHTAGYDYSVRDDADEPIAEYSRKLARQPLKYHPGTAWSYSTGTHVLVSLVEEISGQSFDEFLSERIFQPLGMKDTTYYVPEDKIERLAIPYTGTESGALQALGSARETRGSKVRFGGANGLYSTAGDYLRFATMLLNGGRHGGQSLLSRKTIDLMTANHVGDFSLNRHLGGYRFGLGFRVMTDLGRAAILSSPGEFGWAGSYGSYFWIDPREEMVGIFMTHKRPMPAHIMLAVHTLANQAITE